MKITEVQIKLTHPTHGQDTRHHAERLRAYASITIDDAFAIRDLKVIEGKRGLFIAMPSRKLADHCPACGEKNHLRARFCNQCGDRLDGDRALRDADERPKLHADVAHPINAETRAIVTAAVLDAFAAEIEAADHEPPAEVERHIAAYDAA